MKLEGKHDNFNFKVELDNKTGKTRLTINPLDGSVSSIALKMLPDNNEVFTRIKSWFLTKFTRKWVKAGPEDSNILININSLQKKTGLTAKEIRAAAKNGDLPTKIVAAKLEEQKKAKELKLQGLSERLIQCMENVVGNPEVKERVLDVIHRKENQFVPVELFWSRRGKLLIGSQNVKAYINRDELTSTYLVKANAYYDGKNVYFEFDKGKMEYIEGRFWKGETLATWNGEAPSPEDTSVISEEILKHIRTKAE